MSDKPKRSTVIPLCLLAYLAVMAWLGRERLRDGQYFYYFGVIAASLVIIALVRWSLVRKERLRERETLLAEREASGDDTPDSP